ncbi:MAG TPA: DUF4139 domain-containing protein [Candidatus Baltobacteraceae bacterium]|nr:DUF4139 domain-containing protein [Candidatus Baltobacteraceae bacterium]
MYRLAAFLFVSFVAMCVATLGPRDVAADPAERVVLQQQQHELTLTVYNADLALVHDRRHVEVSDGINRIAWRDVSAQLEPETAILERISGGGVSVLEQNFDYDVLSPGSLLEKNVGHEVTIDHGAARDGRPRFEKATILSVTGGAVLKYADRIETEVDGRILYSSIPPELRDHPTLTIELEGSGSGERELDLSYLTTGLDWRADYVGRVSADEHHLDLTGLVTMTNESGTSFRDGKLLLVAGNVNVPPPTRRVMGEFPAQAQSAYANPGGQQFTEKNFFEYHLYSLSRPTSVADHEQKQITLLSAHNIPLVKTYELRGSPAYYRSQTPDLGERIKVGVFLSFENRGGDLGIPLPGGTVRLYKAESGGASIFLGGDHIDHTPKNETVRLHVGDAFDVTANKKQTDFKILSSLVYRSSYQIVLRNAKNERVEVLVVEPIPGDWTISATSQPFTKSSSASATWKVSVPANGSATLTYTADVRYW